MSTRLYTTGSLRVALFSLTLADLMHVLGSQAGIGDAVGPWMSAWICYWQQLWPLLASLRCWVRYDTLLLQHTLGSVCCTCLHPWQLRSEIRHVHCLCLKDTIWLNVDVVTSNLACMSCQMATQTQRSKVLLCQLATPVSDVAFLPTTFAFPTVFAFSTTVSFMQLMLKSLLLRSLFAEGQANKSSHHEYRRLSTWRWYLWNVQASRQSSENLMPCPSIISIYANTMPTVNFDVVLHNIYTFKVDPGLMLQSSVPELLCRRVSLLASMLSIPIAFSSPAHLPLLEIQHL